MLSKVFKNSLFKSTLIYTISDGINKAIPFFILPVLSYYLTTNDYGVVTNFNVLIGILNILIGLSIEGVIGVNYYRISKDDLARLIFNGCVLILSSTILIFGACFVFRNEIFGLLKIPISYIYWAILMTFSGVLSLVNLAVWRLEEKPIYFGLFKISLTIVNMSVTLLLVIYIKMGWRGSVDAVLIATSLFGFLSLFLLFKRGYFKVNFDKKVVISILAFGLPLVPHSLSIWVRTAIDRIFISNFYSVSDAGLYATGFQFGILISFIMLAFNNAFVPFLYKKLSEKNPVELKLNQNLLKRITYFGAISLFLGSILFYFISVFILNNFYSQEYVGARPFIFWAIISQAFQGLYLFWVNYIFFMKKTKLLATITFSCSLVQVIISYFLIRFIGPLGGAYSAVIVSALNFICVAVYSNRVYEMNWFKFENLFKKRCSNDKNIIICFTIMQMIIASNIIKKIGGHFTIVVLFDRRSKKGIYYSNILKVISSDFYFFSTTNFKPKVFWNLLRLFFWRRRLSKKYNKCYIASIDNTYIHYILSNILFSELYTFDDGSANVAKGSDYYIPKKVSLLDKWLIRIYQVDYDLIKVKDLTRLHYTIYKSLSNIIHKTEYISLFNYSDVKINCNVKTKTLNLFIGQPLNTVLRDYNVSTIEDRLKSLGIDFYYPHPFEIYLPKNIPVIDSPFIFEDFLRAEIVNNPDTLFNIYSFCSSVLLNVKDFPNINLYYLFDVKLVDKFSSVYDLYDQAGIVCLR